MGSVPGHPFFLRVIETLRDHARNWHVPYITVMASTGPLFLSIVWKEYSKWGLPDDERVRILMPAEYSKNSWSFFTVVKGSSWHSGDAKTIFWVRLCFLYFKLPLGNHSRQVRLLTTPQIDGQALDVDNCCWCFLGWCHRFYCLSGILQKQRIQTGFYRKEAL